MDAPDPVALGAEVKPGEVPALRFHPDAQELFDDWRANLEQQLRSPGVSAAPSYAAHLSKYRSLFPSLALLFHMIDVADGQEAGAVSVMAAELALAWTDYLGLHARKLYSAELNPGSRAASGLAGKIRAGKVGDGDTLRDISRNEWAGLDTSDRVRDAAQQLEGTGWLRIELTNSGNRGGRRAEVIRLHPALCAVQRER